MKEILIGLGIGLVIALIVYIWQKIGKNDIEKKSKAEIARLKGMLADRMDIESEGLNKRYRKHRGGEESGYNRPESGCSASGAGP